MIEAKVGDAVIQWYRSELDRDDAGARAARARLRRCESPADALAVEETHDLNERLKNVELSQHPRPGQLALLATTFARLKDIDGDRLATMFGRTKAGGGSRTLSELRFQTLVRARSHLDLMIPLRRSLATLGSNPACDGRALADDLYFWNVRTRNAWCFQYFGADNAEANSRSDR